MKKLFIALIICANSFSSLYECEKDVVNYSIKSSQASCDKAVCTKCRLLTSFDGGETGRGPGDSGAIYVYNQDNNSWCHVANQTQLGVTAQGWPLYAADDVKVFNYSLITINPNDTNNLWKEYPPKDHIVPDCEIVYCIHMNMSTTDTHKPQIYKNLFIPGNENLNRTYCFNSFSSAKSTLYSYIQQKTGIEIKSY